MPALLCVYPIAYMYRHKNLMLTYAHINYMDTLNMGKVEHWQGWSIGRSGDCEGQSIGSGRTLG